ncbi:hypothetical protein T492DRAFT_1055965 [Pavlovales sp. CCMP2436]|nr:hypothetical protein T492DRAFT_1055965 [Pavlovales sp. CCMP2436]|mmetsp:Transcript_23382/g.55402  ORF Transcript_23382/g.55402 Transcript_23382/m.55402 type:complete len:262 (-) Transcript_23382:382-1167(-)
MTMCASGGRGARVTSNAETCDSRSTVARNQLNCLGALVSAASHRSSTRRQRRYVASCRTRSELRWAGTASRSAELTSARIFLTCEVPCRSTTKIPCAKAWRCRRKTDASSATADLPAPSAPCSTHSPLLMHAATTAPTSRRRPTSGTSGRRRSSAASEADEACAESGSASEEPLTSSAPPPPSTSSSAPGARVEGRLEPQSGTVRSAATPSTPAGTSSCAVPASGSCVLRCSRTRARSAGGSRCTACANASAMGSPRNSAG